jgi:mannosyl-oligosaccharide alpha-1,2-mannosidase
MYSRYLSVGAVSILGLCSLTVFAVPHGQDLRNRQSRPDDHALNVQRANGVKEAFTYAWDGYHKYAFPHDELHPVSNGYSDSRHVLPMPERRFRTDHLPGMDGERAP